MLQSTSSHDHSRVRQTQINVDFIPQLQSTTGRAGFILDCEILFMPDHSVRVAATDGACRVIYHAHPANVIALTYVLPLTDRDFSRALWKSATECPVVFPGGVGVVPWMVPGGADIALATCEKMKDYEAAVWAHHGLFVSGPDFDTTFGLMHTIEKSAQIWVLAHSCGQERQTITDDDLRAIAKEFGVTLREEFLS